jgi:hypothetical protein
MKTKFAMTCVMFGTLLESAVAMAADHSDSDRSEMRLPIRNLENYQKQWKQVTQERTAQRRDSAAHFHVRAATYGHRTVELLVSLTYSIRCSTILRVSGS